MHRRTLLALGSAVAFAACSEDDPGVSAPRRGPRRVAYGAGPDQFAELTEPESHPRGLAVLVHGGFWKPEYGIEYARPLVPSLVERGWATWTIEYRRGTGAQHTLDDVLAALAARPLDVPTTVGIGHSAGGHLVAWAAAAGDGLTHVMSQAGVLDLRSAHDEGLGSSAVERFLGHPPGPGDADVDPIRQVPLAVPVWCVHGRDDDVVPVTQSRAYVAAARAADGTAELVEVDGDHFAVIDPESAAWARQLEILDALA